MDRLRFVIGKEIVYADVETVKQIQASKRTATLDLIVKADTAPKFKEFIGDVVKDKETVEEGSEEALALSQEEYIVPKYASLNKGSQWFDLKDMTLIEEPVEVTDSIFDETKFVIQITGIGEMGDTEIAAINMEDILGIEDDIVDDDEFVFNFIRKGDTTTIDDVEYKVDNVNKYCVIMITEDEDGEERKYKWSFKKTREIFEQDDLVKLRELEM